MVNDSKKGEARFWEKWQTAGAVGRCYTNCRTADDLVEAGIDRFLDETQAAIVKSYARPFARTRLFGSKAQKMIDFLCHPGQFVPTDFTLRSAYVNLVCARTFDRKLPGGRTLQFCYPNEITTEEIDWRYMRNVEVGIEYRPPLFPDGMDVCPILVISADVRKDPTAEWSKKRDRGYGFNLDSFIQRI